MTARKGKPEQNSPNGTSTTGQEDDGMQTEMPRQTARTGLLVSYPGKGGCADPVNEDAILEGVGGRPPGQSRKRQLASDTGDGKT
jgi:hypothetical protein